MAQNIKEFVAKKVIEDLEKSNIELAILRYLFSDRLLKCVLCDSFVVPFDTKKEEFRKLLICPCEFCYIDDFNETYEYGSIFKRGLGKNIRF